MDFSCVDAFCGAGGLTLGLSNAGFDILLSFDNDSKSIQTQRMNKKYFNHNIMEVDINDLFDGHLLEICNLKKGELFFLAGGPPCQGFSVQRIGNDYDFRNEMVIRYIDLVEETMPRFFLMENVPGLKGKRGKSILSQAIRKAEQLGYIIHKKMLDAQDYGAPQRRKRVFIIGERNGSGLRTFNFPCPTVSKSITVRDTIAFLPPPPDDFSDHPEYSHHRKDRLSELNKKRLKALKPGQGRENLPVELLADCHLRDASKIGHRKVYGRMAWDEVSPTITARFDSFTRGQFGHPNQIRTISLREGALLQTFPLDMNFVGTKVEVARQIGNAVPPLLAEVIGRQIIKCYKSSIIQ